MRAPPRTVQSDQSADAWPSSTGRTRQRSSRTSARRRRRSSARVSGRHARHVMHLSRETAAPDAFMPEVEYLDEPFASSFRQLLRSFLAYSASEDHAEARESHRMHDAQGPFLSTGSRKHRSPTPSWSLSRPPSWPLRGAPCHPARRAACSPTTPGSGTSRGSSRRSRW